MKISIYAVTSLALTGLSLQAVAQTAAATCTAQSTDKITPVIELYTSEGCSSCPPADKWLSTLKAQQAKPNGAPLPVVQAFHVNYWNYIGWADRFAMPDHTLRQKQVSAWQQSHQIYTPQVVKDGRDWRNWHQGRSGLVGSEPASLVLTVQQERRDVFSAIVAPKAGAAQSWAAYWTVTENGHSTKVLRGENSGEQLTHDFVVRQYQSAGEHSGAGRLVLQTIAKDPAYMRQINLVVFNPQTGKPLQAVSLICG
jgi:hypothetical protein